MLLGVLGFYGLRASVLGSKGFGLLGCLGSGAAQVSGLIGPRASNLRSCGASELVCSDSHAMRAHRGTSHTSDPPPDTQLPLKGGCAHRRCSERLASESPFVCSKTMAPGPALKQQTLGPDGPDVHRGHARLCAAALCSSEQRPEGREMAPRSWGGRCSWAGKALSGLFWE